MSNERIDLTQFEEMEGWRIDEGNDVYHIVKENGESVISTWSENRNEDDSLELALKLVSLPKVIAELKRCYNAIDDLKWNHMQVLRERKDLRDSGLSMAKKADFQGNRIESLIDALRIIRDDLDEAIAQGHLPIKSADGIDATKIRNFANDATQ